MSFPLSSDYIKYLNDPLCRGLNYDQWKEKKINQQLAKTQKNEYRKVKFH